MLTPDKKHIIVFIVYHGPKPFEVITKDIENGCMTYWDFMTFNNDPLDIRHYESGGGSRGKITAPKYVKGCKDVSYWIDPLEKFKGSPRNCKKLKRPKPVKSYFVKSINPFKVSEEVNSYDYCEKCGTYSSDVCPDHQYWDDTAGEVKYFDEGKERGV